MKASILIPAFNASQFIEATLQSCIDQGVEWIEEIIVIDDHSTDATSKVVADFSILHPDIPIQLHLNNSKGACAARNHAFSLAKGEAIQWLDADDLLGPGKLEAQLQLLESHPTFLIASKWRRFKHDLSQLWPEEKEAWEFVPKQSTPLEWLQSERMVGIHSWLGTRELFEQAGNWDETLLINQDGEYFSRAVAASEGVLFEPHARVFYRSQLNNSVSQFNPSKAPSLFRSIESYEQTLLGLGPLDVVKTTIANHYQGYIYRTYPNAPDLLQKANAKVQEYGPPTRRNDVAESLVAQMISRIFGWKALVQLRILFKR